MMSKREQLLAESKGVKDSAKWLKKRIKSKKKAYDNRSWFVYDSEQSVEYRLLEELNEVRKSLEKYAKKLQHQAYEEL